MRLIIKAQRRTACLLQANHLLPKRARVSGAAWQACVPFSEQ
jgi:hypothetical protein